LRNRYAVPGVIAAGAFVLVVLIGPGWATEHAAKSHTACSNRDYEDRPAVDESCDSSGWLWLPKLVPWKRKAALEREISIQRNVAGRALKLATSFRPDAAARARAADAAALVYRREREDATAPASEGLSALLALEGDADGIRRHSAVANTALSANNVLRALLYTGDLEAAVAFARARPRLVAEDQAARDLYFTEGVLLCLAKDQPAGVKSLREAERVHGQFQALPYAEGRIARAACGDGVTPGVDDPARDAIRSFASKGVPLEKESPSPFVVAALLAREPTPEEALVLLASIPRVPWIGMAPLPWSSKLASASLVASYPVLLDPERHEKAAALLEKLAGSATGEAPAELRHHSRGLLLEAASGWSAQGNAERTEAAAARAHALAPSAETAVLATPSLLGVGSFARAGTLLSTTERGEASPSTRALLSAFEAQIFAHFERWKEARIAAETGLATAKELRSSDLALPITEGLRWLLLAIALRTGDVASAPALLTPEIYERDPRAWHDLIALPEPERAILRWRMRTVEIGSLPISLPAQMFVIGEAARGSDVEVWLDHALGIFDRRLAGAPALRARAEAARYRGDAKAEADYLARAGRLEKLLGDPRQRALGSLIGL
jgi:hypothetical protein